jgi:hypothetical protein
MKQETDVKEFTVSHVNIMTDLFAVNTQWAVQETKVQNVLKSLKFLTVTVIPIASESKGQVIKPL